MADQNTPGDNNSNSSVATEASAPSEEDVKRAEEFKEKANDFFKSMFFLLSYVQPLSPALFPTLVFATRLLYLLMS